MPTGCPLGYREVIFPSTKMKSVSQGRDSGGMLIWYLKMRPATTKHKETLICGDLYARTGTEPDLINAQGDKQMYLTISTSHLLDIGTGATVDNCQQKWASTAAVMSHAGSVHSKRSASRGILCSLHTQLSSWQQHSGLYYYRPGAPLSKSIH